MAVMPRRQWGHGDGEGDMPRIVSSERQGASVAGDQRGHAGHEVGENLAVSAHPDMAGAELALEPREQLLL